MSSILPGELLCAIFELVPKYDAPDTPGSSSSLKNCSMVSRRWRSLAEPYLFRQVTICPGDTRFNLQAFDILLDHSPHVSRLIRELSVDGSDVLGQDPSSSLDPPGLAVSLSKLPSLESLLIVTCHLSNTDVSRVPETLKHLKSLRRLSLQSVRCLGPAAYSSIAAVLCLFSSIDTLQLRWLGTAGTGPIDEQLFSRGALKVNTLDVDIRRLEKEHSRRLYVKTLQLAGVLSTCHTLALAPNGIAVVKYAADIIEHDNIGLHTIVLDFRALWNQSNHGIFDNNPDALLKLVDPLRAKLSLCTALHRLTVKLNREACDAETAAPSLSWIASLRQLRHLTVEIERGSWERLVYAPVLPWCGIELSRLCRQLPGLKSIAVMLNPGEGVARYATLESELMGDLQGVQNKGILYAGRDPSCIECHCQEDIGV